MASFKSYLQRVGLKSTESQPVGVTNDAAKSPAADSTFKGGEKGAPDTDSESIISVGEEKATVADPTLNPGELSFEEGMGTGYMPLDALTYLFILFR